MKALMILENGFEDTEALASFDVLKRAGFEVVSASLDNTCITTQCGHSVSSSILVKDIKDLNAFDFLVIPGGRAVFKVLDNSKAIDDLIDFFYNKKKLIACICAAPMLVGKRGYFKGLNYTCFPGCEEKINEGYKGKDGVIESGNFITATSMYYSIPFALKIVEHYKGIEYANNVLNSLKGIR